MFLSDKRFQGILLGFSFFTFSFSSFSMRGGIVAYFFLSLFVLINHKLIQKVKLSKYSSFLFFFVVAYVTLSNFLSEDIYMIYYFKFVLLFVYFFVCSIFLSTSNGVAKGVFIIALIVYVVLHSVSFYSQFFGYLLFDYYPDYNSFVREKDSNTAFMTRDLVGSIIPIRATGFFSEPSFYSLSIFPALTVLIHLGAKHRWVIFFGFLSVVLSLSVAAILVTFLWFTSYVVFNRTNTKLKLMVISGLVTVSILFGGFLIQRAFNSNDYDSASTRLNLVHEILERNLKATIIGAGYFINEHGMNGTTSISPATIRDSGFFMSTLYSGGILGVLFVYSIIVFYVRKFSYFVSIFTVLLFKYAILFSPLWLCFLFYLTLSSYKTYNGCNKMSDN